MCCHTHCQVAAEYTVWMLRRLLSGAGLALGAFHVWLFGRQAMSGALASPEVLLKWIAALGLAAALIALRRSGISLVRGRKAVAVWVLAALLHAPAVGERLEALEIPAIPEAAISLTQTLAAAVALAGVLLLLWIGRRTTAAPRFARASAAPLLSPWLSSPARFAFAPRPPPSV